jgi:NAD(P)-dependent dehydrogenase (short-subunit alcohol dehydrogenase family)
MRLQEKVALVTGGSRGIGRAISLGFAHEGADVAVGFVQDESAANKTVREIEELGRRPLSVRADTSRRDEVETMIRSVVDFFGRIDILVNNASILKRTPFLEISEEEWDRVLAINLKGYFLVGQAVAREMVKQRSGTIINISSVNQEIAGVNLTHYCSAKGGVRLLTRQMALELAPYNVRVNSIAPGLIETDLNRSDIASEEFRTYRLAMIPMGVIGTPQDVVGAAIFLASAESRLATGATIILDGGQTVI